jgi:hypothetical protein
MGRISTLFYLSPEHQESLKACIRSHQYVNLDLMMVDLKKRGITGITRSALHRHVVNFKESDALCASPDEGTVVTIIERGSGEVRVIKTCASGLSIATMLEKIKGTTVLS